MTEQSLVLKKKYTDKKKKNHPIFLTNGEDNPKRYGLLESGVYLITTITELSLQRSDQLSYGNHQIILPHLHLEISDIDRQAVLRKYRRLLGN